MKRFYAPSVSGEQESIELDAEQSHHLKNVLRIAAGDEIQLFDGKGKEFLCAVQDTKRKSAPTITVSVIREFEPVAGESHLDLTLAASITKMDRYEIAIQKAVELGVKQFVPLFSARSDKIHRKTNFERKLERWRKIILDATKQCGRAYLMQISDPVNFKEFALEAREIRLMFAESDGEKFDKVAPNQVAAGRRITAVIGPEGGWESDEIKLASESGFGIITLGGRILRTETAAIAITALLQHRFGDLA